MEISNWTSQCWWIFLFGFINCFHTGCTELAGGGVIEDSAIISLSDLEQSQTFLNIISPVSSVPPIEGRDAPKTIPISSSTGPTNYDDNEDDVVLVDRLGSNDASVLVKDPSRPIIPRPAATRTLRNNNNTKKKKRRKLKVPGRPSTSAKAAKERRRRKKKKMRSWPSSARKDDALSLRHEPVLVSVVDEDADDNDNDNNLTKITNEDIAVVPAGGHATTNLNGTKTTTKGRKRKMKRRRKDNGPKKSLSPLLPERMMTKDEEGELELVQNGGSIQKQRQMLKNVHRRRRQRLRLLRLKEDQQMAKGRDSVVTAAAKEQKEQEEEHRLERQRTAKFHLEADDDDNEEILSSAAAAVAVVAGDLSCMKGEFRHAPPVLHADIQYSRNDENGHETATLEARYMCASGYELRGPRKPLLCRRGEWIGEIPIACEPVETRLVKVNETLCPSSSGQCDQLCSVNTQSGQHECSCFRGFTMQEGTCRDIDECGGEAVCQFGKCINTIGSFRCYCPKGFRQDGIHCTDVNECLLRNNHGPCQDVCTNTHGSFECGCGNLPGTVLAADGQRCEFEDDCEKNNGGCSHTCLTANGRAFCDCPSRWTLDPVAGKQCLDIDECESKGMMSTDCQFSCLNTPGSYKCVTNDYYSAVAADQPIIEVLTCPPGHQRNDTTGSCEDTDECVIDNGGCFDVCANTVGSFHCSCREGFVFAADKFSCVVNEATTADGEITCPPLFPPRHGYLECTRNLVEGGRRRRVTNRAGTVCILKCPLGFHVVGGFSQICGGHGNWTGADNGTCSKYPQPSIVCPKSERRELTANETATRTIYYSVPAAASTEEARNQAPALHLQISPQRAMGSKSNSYGANDVVELTAPGKYKFTYSSGSGLSPRSSCQFTVEIQEGEPPQLLSCPTDQMLTVGNQYETVEGVWTPPQFTDNIGVTSVTSSMLPGSHFGLGSHKVTYVASDAAGYSTECVFRILVRLPKWKYFNYLQLPRDI